MANLLYHTDLEMVYSYFPRLKERRKSQAGYTSGGEQQMCAIGRALMSKPETILLDEPSMGLAPQLVEEIFGIVKDLNEKEGVSFLLAEQNTNIALRFAHYGYILESGRVVMDGSAKELRENPDVKEFYLGMSEGGGNHLETSEVIDDASVGLAKLGHYFDELETRSDEKRAEDLARTLPGHLTNVRDNCESMSQILGEFSLDTFDTVASLQKLPVLRNPI